MTSNHDQTPNIEAAAERKARLHAELDPEIAEFLEGAPNVGEFDPSTNQYAALQRADQAPFARTLPRRRTFVGDHEGGNGTPPPDPT